MCFLVNTLVLTFKVELLKWEAVLFHLKGIAKQRLDGEGSSPDVSQRNIPLMALIGAMRSKSDRSKSLKTINCRAICIFPPIYSVIQLNHLTCPLKNILSFSDSYKVSCYSNTQSVHIWSIVR